MATQPSLMNVEYEELGRERWSRGILRTVTTHLVTLRHYIYITLFYILHFTPAESSWAKLLITRAIRQRDKGISESSAACHHHHICILLYLGILHKLWPSIISLTFFFWKKGASFCFQRQQATKSWRTYNFAAETPL